MEAIFARLLDTLNSSVATLFAILLIAFWCVYKLGGIVKTFSDFKEENKGLKTDIGGMKDSLAKINATTDLLYQAHLSTVQSHSPMSLTEKGKDIASKISAQAKVDAHWPDIKTLVDKRSPSNPYDVQTVSLDIARQCFDRILSVDEQSEIKAYAYQSGMNLLEIYPILGIMIRDKVLRERGLGVEEVDKHDPSKR